MEFSKEFLICV